MITIKVPGKLMLTGEWAILEPGNRCIVMAIDKYLTATCEKNLLGGFQRGNAFGSFSLPDMNLPLITATYINNKLNIITPLTPEQEKKFSMVKTATELALGYLAEASKFRPLPPAPPQEFCLTITSEISTITLQDGTNHKLGFGSSSASIVATIKALFAHAGHDITTQENLEQIFKLSVIAHYIAQGNCGSGFDIAAAAYGTTLVYERFDPNVILRGFAKGERLSCNLISLITLPWPGLKITPIKLPQNIIVLVGFSGSSASTSALVSTMNEYKNRDKELYMRIISSIDNLVKEIAATIIGVGRSPQHPPKRLFDDINQNRTLLAQLAHSAGIELETPALTKLITIAQKWGACAKFSGAGGGDCGFALCSDIQIAEKIKQDWLDNGIIPIDVKII